MRVSAGAQRGAWQAAAQGTATLSYSKGAYVHAMPLKKTKQNPLVLY